MAGFMDRIRQSFSVLTNRMVVNQEVHIIGSSYGPSGLYGRSSSEAVLAPIVTRISSDAAAMPMRHVDVNEDGAFKNVRRSELNRRLTIDANIDQTGTDLIRDIVMTMLDHGSVAIVPVTLSGDPRTNSSYDILSMRAGVIETWYNRSVDVSIYNEESGEREVVPFDKRFIAIAYNPLYRIMNETNSTLSRLKNKLSLLDLVDSRAGSPNLDLILQMPFSLKTEKRKQEAQRRLLGLEEQLENSRLGIAYIGPTEKITQLNRPVINNLVEQVDSLTKALYNQLGLTDAVFTGTASPEEMVAYYNRTIDPILRAVTEAMRRTFLTRTAQTQGQDIMSFPNIFKMAPIDVLADAADKLSRNEIMSSNELRPIFGLRPRDEEGANELRNKNLNRSDNEAVNSKPSTDQEDISE